MNDDRRKVLQKVIEGLTLMQKPLEGAKDDESDYYENMSEGLQNGEKGEQTQAAVDNLSEAVDNLQATIDKIEEVLNN